MNDQTQEQVMRVDHDDRAKHREAYRRQRDVLAHATTAHLFDLLDAEDDLKRTAARDELQRRNETLTS